MSQNTRLALWRYGVAVAAVGLALLLRFALGRLLDQQDPFLLYWPAVVFAAWYGGLGPGILATVLSVWAAQSPFLIGQGELSPDQKRIEATGIIFFLVLGLFITALIHWLSVARQREIESAQKLFQQREWFRGTLASIGDAVIATDRDGQITFLNKQAQNLTGWDGGEAMGRSLEVVFPIVGEQSGRPLENPLRKALRTGTVVTLSSHTVLLCRDGSNIALDDSAAPIRSEDGQFLGGVLVFRDVSARREAEKLIQQSEARFRRLVESNIIGIVVAREDGALTSANDAFLDLVGRGRAELEAGRLRGRDLTPPQYHDLDDGALREAKKRGSCKPYEKEYQRPDGSRVPVLLGFTRLEQSPSEYICFILDLTSQKQLEEELRQRGAQLAESDRHKDEFLAMLAHELRNPLASLANAVKILRLRDRSAHEQQWARAIIERQVKYIARMVDDLLDTSRISRGLIHLQKETVDLATVVARAVEWSQSLLDQRRHELEVRLPPEAVWLEADPTRLEQILANLLNNAAHYTEPGGRLGLTGQVEGDQLVLKVRDTGRGIPRDVLPHIFNLFMQGKRGLAPSESGLGIGLTLVRRLVELHGGSVAAHSDGPGHGSEFVVRLPFLQEAPAMPPESEPASSATTASRRILIVDDNETAADTFALLLRVSGHEVRTVHDGFKALEEARAFRPEVVLLDIGLPEMDGYEVARRLRREPELNGVLLVAITGYGQEQDRLRSQEAGFNHHLVKPVGPEAVEALLAAPNGN